jgi:hypothetical protein
MRPCGGSPDNLHVSSKRRHRPGEHDRRIETDHHQEGTVMRNALSVVIASAAIGVLAATAAPANAESANLTIDQLEAQGFDVRVTRLGSAPLDECEVTDIGNVQEQKRLVNVEGFNDRNAIVPVVVKRTITVSLDCSR